MPGKARLVVAVLAVCAGAARAGAADLACTMDATTGRVTCTLSTRTSWVDLQYVVNTANALNKYIDSRSPMIITAFGGAGAKGDGNMYASGGDLGEGGSARLATTLDDLKAILGSTTIYYYLGAQGEGNHPGGKGGASTLVAREDLVHTATTTNVLLLAGGGGGGGAAGGFYAGHAGGDGGRVTSTVGTANTAAGKNGNSGSGSGGGGEGGALSSGGKGGKAGSGADAKAGGDGKNGVGGQGGPVHISDGASTSTGWINGDGTVPAGIGTSGMGGEGQVRCDGCGEGGGGGGGYGGGGGGGGGGYSILLGVYSTTAGGGGGGGASYAVASTVDSSTTAKNPGHDGSVVIILEEVCAGTEGRGEKIAQELLDDFVPVFNQDWPTIAVAEGLDPYMDVYDKPVNIGCNTYGIGDLTCPLVVGVAYPACKNFYANVDVSEIDGLSHLAITSLELESTNQQVGTSCPYDSKAVENTSFRCSLYGNSGANVKLTAPAKVVVSSIQLMIECTDGVLSTTAQLWAGKATCKSTSGTASGKVAYCSGICSKDAGVSSLVALQASDLKMKLDPKCDPTTTSVDYPPINDTLDAILGAVMDGASSAMVDAVSPAITSALNTLVKDVLPLPATCEKETGGRKGWAASLAPPAARTCRVRR
jgi:hypothetical protein